MEIDETNKRDESFMYQLKDDEISMKEYARAYILPQKYENLYSCKEAFKKGTIFKDLYSKYDEDKNKIC